MFYLKEWTAESADVPLFYFDSKIEPADPADDQSNPTRKCSQRTQKCQTSTKQKKDS